MTDKDAMHTEISNLPANGRSAEWPYENATAAPDMAGQLTFAEGMVGCPTWQHFVLKEPAETAPVGVLQCLDEPEVSFYVVPPQEVMPDYALELAAAERAALALADMRDLNVRCILVVRAEPYSLSANLLGPIVWNGANGLARQVVLANSGYSARHMLSDGGPSASSGQGPSSFDFRPGGSGQGPSAGSG
jgi:flagellar assembly factor FliW